jgi:hypothetical protein
MRKVLLLPDTRGWAYDIIAQSIAPHFKRYDPTIKYVGEVLRGTDKVNFNDYDVVLGFFWYDMVTLGPKHYKNYHPRKVCVGIHGHNSWIKRKIPQAKAVKMVSIYPGVGCISEKLMRVFRSANPVFTPSGYGSNLKLQSFKVDDKVKFLWVGDPGRAHHGDIKGYNDIIKPVFDARKDVELITATKASKIPYSKMHDFYYRGHVGLCMSETEGSPLPIIESMACGRPVISTDVGIVPELVTNKNGIIVGRNKAALNRAIDQMVKNKAKLPTMGKEARASVEPRSWAKCAAHYERLFDKVK